jgi:hypothetical protein
VRVLIGALAVLAATLPAPATALAAGATASCTPGGCTGWHTGPVRVAWTLSPDTNYSQGCDVTTISAEGTTRRVCSVSTDGTTFAATAVQIDIDGTAPVVTGATTSRAADGSGWFRAPVDVTFTGSDATSGIESCTTVGYAGPDDPSASVGGTCRDRAGNVSAPGTFALRYDATAPAVSAPSAEPGDGVVALRWTAPPDAVDVTLVRAPADGGAEELVHHGPGGEATDRAVRNGTRYRYTLRAADAAGNVAAASVEAEPGARLLGPAHGARVGGPPLLRWTKVRGARYYNVQLYRDGHKLLSRWPRRAHYQLRERWTFGGRRYRLRPGRYRWYVWPGKGRPSERRYGRLVGRGAFSVAA